MDFLSRQNVASGEADRNAKREYEDQRTKKTVEETLPKAWYRLVAEPDDLLVELVSETTKDICGVYPERGVVEGFLARLGGGQVQLEESESPASSVVPLPPIKTAKLKREVRSGEHVRGLTLLGQHYSVRMWNEMILTTSSVIYTRHRTEFHKALGLRGTRRSYFSRDPSHLNRPRRVDESEFYVETHMHAHRLVDLERRLVKLFGYAESDLVIETVPFNAWQPD